MSSIHVGYFLTKDACDSLKLYLQLRNVIIHIVLLDLGFPYTKNKITLPFYFLYVCNMTNI